MADAGLVSLLTASNAKAAPNAKAASKAINNDEFVLSARSTLWNHRIALDLLYDDKNNRTIPDNTGNHSVSAGYKLGNYRIRGAVACDASEGGGNNLPRTAILAAVGCVCTGVAFAFLWNCFSKK